MGQRRILIAAALAVLLVLVFLCRRDDSSDRTAAEPPWIRSRAVELLEALPAEASRAELIEALDPIVGEINRSRRSERAAIRAALGRLAEQPEAVQALAAYYEELDLRSWRRPLTLRIVGALRRPDALRFLQSVVAERAGKDASESRALERVQRAAVRGIGYLRSRDALATVVEIATTHPSESVRIEAVETYMWNRGDGPDAELTLRTAIPAELWRYITRPRFYRGVEQRDFDAQVLAWRRQWATPADPDAPNRPDTTPTPVVAADSPCDEALTTESDLQMVSITQGSQLRGSFFRDYMYNLKEKDWNEGWGYEATPWLTPPTPFDQMFHAAYLLEYGIEPVVHPTLTGPSGLAFWTGRKVHEGLANADDYRTWLPGSAAVDSLGRLHVLTGRAETYEELLHFRFDGSAWTVENVTQLSQSASLSAGSFGRIAIHFDPDGTLHAFAHSWDFELLHWWKPPEGPWQAENVTRDVVANAPSFVASPPAVIRTAYGPDPSDPSGFSPTLHVFGIDWNANSLSHYRLAGGVWSAGGSLPSHPSVSDSVVAAFEDPRRGFHVIASDASNGIVHFSWKPGDGWRATHVAGGAQLGPTRVTAIFSPLGTLHVFGVAPVSAGGGLVHMFRPRDGEWAVTHVSQVDISPFAGAIAMPDESVHHFALGPNNDVIHHMRSKGGLWSHENLTALPGVGESYRIGSNPVPLVGPESTIDVFGRHGEYVIHYYWSAEHGWRADNFGNRGHIAIEPVAVAGAGEKQHVLSVDEDWNLVHFEKLSEPVSAPWHSDWFYSMWARGANSGFKYKPVKSIEGAAADARKGPVQVDEVRMSCVTFEDRQEDFGRSAAGSVAIRSVIMLHEATHIRYADFWGQLPHDLEKPRQMDFWLAHTMQSAHQGASYLLHPHMPWQIGIEYLADLGEFADLWVPYSIYGEACEDANLFMSNHILGDPGWRCGELRPF